MTSIKAWAILNSGATSNFLFLTTNAPTGNIQPADKPLVAQLPNGAQVQLTHTCLLNLPMLPAAVRQAHIIPGLALHSLVSVVTLTNAGCKVHFIKIGCMITHRGKTILCGSKCTRTSLWMIPLTTSPALIPEQATASALLIAVAANIDATSTAAEHAHFIHQALCLLLAATLLCQLATSSELVTILGLIAHLIQHHLPRSTTMDKGHMRQHQQGIQFTRSEQQAIIQTRNEVDHLMPTEEICTAHDMFCFAALANLHTSTMYTDHTGAFPVRSFKNMQYIFVAYIYDLNAILVHAMPSKNNAAMIAAFSNIFSTLAAHGYAPTLNVMDNKCFKAVEAHIKAK
jgi:hypothetical protein